MSGVYDKQLMDCPECKRRTEHLTGWESEEPNTIDVQCVPCHGERWVTGRVKSVEYAGLTERRVFKPRVEPAS